MKQHGFHVDIFKCTGCKTCEMACKDAHDLEVGVNWRRIYEYTGGDWTRDGACWNQNVFSYYVSLSCNHCEKPACVKACPSGAMHKRSEDGLVVVNGEVCVGCKYCEMACPYGAPQYNPAVRHMTKCTGCYDLLAEGLKPICVAACPLRALEFGPMDELRTKYGRGVTVAPLPVSTLTTPNLLVHPSRACRPQGSREGSVRNWEECKNE